MARVKVVTDKKEKKKEKKAKADGGSAELEVRPPWKRTHPTHLTY